MIGGELKENILDQYDDIVSAGLYRAYSPSIDDYVKGLLGYDGYENFYYIVTISPVDEYKKYVIERDTLAISLPDMFDINKTALFASLQKDGKGGDIITPYSNEESLLPRLENPIVCVYKAGHFHFAQFNNNVLSHSTTFEQIAYHIGFDCEFNKINYTRNFKKSFKIIGIKDK